MEKLIDEPFPAPAIQQTLEEPPHLALGRRGEKMACRFLWKRGFRVIGQNYRGSHGEIDIIAEKQGRIRFIEVKTRTAGGVGDPEDRVDHKKREALRKTAQAYLDSFAAAPPGGFQFDVIAQVLNPATGKAQEQRLIENAF